MSRLPLLIVFALLPGFALACVNSHSSRPVVVAQPAPAPTPAPAPVVPAGPSEVEQLAFDLGSAMVEDLDRYFFTESEVDWLLKGVQMRLDRGSDSRGPDLAERKNLATALQEVARERAQARLDGEKKASASYLASLKIREGAEFREEDGIVVLAMTPGSGNYPEAEEWVRIHSRATLRDGTVIGDTYSQGQPSTIQAQYFLPCWQRVLPDVKVGGSASFACPSDLVYGDKGRAGTILPGAMVQFDIEIIEIVDDPRAAQREDQFSEGESESATPPASH